MTRKFKALGLAIVAMAAMSMAAASGVQAAELHATHPGDVVTTGQQVVDFKLQITHETGGPNTQCKKANFEGTHAWNGVGQQNTAQEVSLTLVLTECTSFGIGAQVLINGCKLTITGKANTNTGVTTAKTAYLDVTGCTAGKQIEVVTPLCVVTIPEQHNIQHIVFSNTTEAGKPHHIHANITITGIKYEVHKVNAFCPHVGTEPRTDAQLTGQATFRDYKKTGQHQVTEHGHQFQKQTHNNEQVGLIAT